MTLSVESANRIALLYHAAKRNGSLVSVGELSKLLQEGASESDVEEAIAFLPSLSSRFELRSGYLTERSDGLSTGAILLEAKNRRIARTNLFQASRFASLLRSSGFSLVAVSGSTSYGSASLSRDADLFCVAPTGRMWASLTRGLVMARAYALVHRHAPSFCLSCVMDVDYARSSFGTRRHLLFARDALEAKVLRGRDLYDFLMSSATWISDYYPVAYREMVRTPAGKLTGAKAPTAFSLALNRVLLKTVGRYVQAKSSLLNRRFKATRRGGDLFGVRCGEDHLIYESRRYLDLKKEYDMAERRQLAAEVTS
jgi:hypothetical protein